MGNSQAGHTRGAAAQGCHDHRGRVDPETCYPVKSASPSCQDRMVGLPVGTRVQKCGIDRRARSGIVMPHEPEHSQGSFPARFDDGIWEVFDASCVIVLEPSKGGGR